MPSNGSRAVTGLCLLMLLGAGACGSAEQRYGVLSTFFDGVPPPGSPLANAVAPPRLAPLPEVSPTQPVFTGSIHGPYSRRFCTSCHDSVNANELVSSTSELCDSCHDPDEFPGRSRHAPAASSQCRTCHDPHRSALPSLLVDTTPALCTACHDNDTFPALVGHLVRYGDACLDCHAPHAGHGPALLREKTE
ncbi:MAG: hypothetical protein H8E45_08635 [Proteobacteria bacterium]|nr:hypothetical protein [Pseudomonadota bacterium]